MTHILFSILAAATIFLDTPFAGWTVRPLDLSSDDPRCREVKAVVPGCVFVSYVEAGLEEDPDYADNIYRVDESFYAQPFLYRTTVKLSPREGQRVWLHFDNTNRYADFLFNGTKVSGTPSSMRDVSGHMMRSKFDVTSLVKEGDNEISVIIYDADQKKTRTGQGPYGVACSPSYLAGAGWDWTPYVPGRLNGITGHAYIRICGSATLEDPWMRTDLSDDFSKAGLRFSTTVRNALDKPSRVTVRGTVEPGGLHFSKSVDVPASGSAQISLEKVLKSPALWWPNGYGEPNLYTCHLECKVGGTVSDERDISFGVRKYSYDFPKNERDSCVLNFLVNGKRIFVKGGNWGLSEYLLRCHGDQYGERIALHKEMNYNMIRLWTGCVTDDEFYDWCDRYGIMVWDDFWLYVSYSDVAEPEAFKANALDKVRRLRNHACIALWCGANECSPKPELDNYLRNMIAEEDGGDRLYKSCSNQNTLSGSGWWRNFTPKHHFGTSASNLAFNKPPYPYGENFGYGMRSEIGTATFPTYESICRFIPEEDRWPLPSDEELRKDNENVWNRHFFGREASNASPIDYKKAVNEQYGESSSLEEFCAKAQLLNYEVVRGMYEAWNDKMWHDAAGILLWMSHPAYPCFVWQTYDYYLNKTGAFYGAQKACEPLHVQWNCNNGSVKVINTTSSDLEGATVSLKVLDSSWKEVESLSGSWPVSVSSSDKAEAFRLSLPEDLGLCYVILTLSDASGEKITDNFYWWNATSEYDYRACDPETIYCKIKNKCFTL